MASSLLNLDAIVVGSGLAGFAAATALKQRNKNVAIFSRAGGATSVSSGAWDFGHIDGDSSLEEHFLKAPWQDVYHRLLFDDDVNADKIVRSANETADVLRKHLPIALNFKKPLCLPTSDGSWKKTFGAHEIQARANAADIKGKRVGLVTSGKWRYRGDLVAKRLGDVSVFEIALNLASGDWSLPHLATRLSHHRAFREELFDAVRKKLKLERVDVLLFPPLFLELEFVEALRKELGVEIAECLSTVEPIAGERLTRAIAATLGDLAIPFHTAKQLQAEVAEGKIQSLQLLSKMGEGWETHSAKHYVLATGKFFGGGVNLGYEGVNETLLDLPLFVSRDFGRVRRRSELPWRDQRFSEEQTWVKLGVWVDRKWRVIDGAGSDAVLGNVHACGSLVGGADFAREGLGMGFMAFSGRQCGHQVG